MEALAQLAYSLLPGGAVLYWLVFFSSICESFVIIGTLVPGMTIVALAGFAASQGVADIWLLYVVAVIGAILGNTFSYFLGTKGTRYFKDENRLLKASYLKAGEAFFKKHGSKSVFLARFAPPIRSIVPFIAGVSRMDFWLFTFWNTVSALCWAAAVLAIGWFFGNAYDTLEYWLSHTGAGIIAGLIVIFVLWRFGREARPKWRTVLDVVKRRRERRRHASTQE